jgi:hypothetical protein
MVGDVPMSQGQPRIDQLQKAVHAQLREFDETCAASELEGLVHAIAAHEDPNQGRWLGGAAYRGDASAPGKTPSFVTAAHSIVHQSGVRQRICAALTSGTGDAFDVGKILVPVLVPLSLAGTIAVPLTPIVTAAIALVIARMGVAAFCKDAP